MEVIQYPNSPFKLHQPFPPAGDQPTATCRPARRAFRRPCLPNPARVTGSGKPTPWRTSLLKAAAPPSSWRTTKPLPPSSTPKCASFSPKMRWNIFVSYYDYYQPEAYVPSRDLFIEKDSAINEHIEQNAPFRHQKPDDRATT